MLDPAIKRQNKNLRKQGPPAAQPLGARSREHFARRAFEAFRLSPRSYRIHARPAPALLFLQSNAESRSTSKAGGA